MNYIHNPGQIALYGDDDQILAEVTFPDIDAATVDVNHTFVDSSLRGKGIAGELMRELAEELRASHRKAVPTCSYAVHWFESHPEAADLLK